MLYLILFLLCCFSPQESYSQLIESQVDSNSTLMSFPIHSSPEVLVIAKVPENYKVVDSKKVKTPENQSFLFLEYAPEGEDVDNWKTLRSYFYYVGYKLDASDLIKKVRLKMLESAELKVRENPKFYIKDLGDGIEYAHVNFIYKHDDRRDRISIVAYSGLNGTVMFQHAYLMDDEIEGDEEKMKESFKEFHSSIEILR